MPLCFGYGESIAGLMAGIGIDLEEKILCVIQVGLEAVFLEHILCLELC